MKCADSHRRLRNRPACAAGHGSVTEILRRMEIVGLPLVGTLNRGAGKTPVSVRAGQLRRVQRGGERVNGPARYSVESTGSRLSRGLAICATAESVRRRRRTWQGRARAHAAPLLLFLTTIWPRRHFGPAQSASDFPRYFALFTGLVGDSNCGVAALVGTGRGGEPFLASRLE